MNSFLRVVLLALCSLIIGCASDSGQFAASMNEKVGVADKSSVVSTFGVPDKQVALNPESDVWEYRLNEQKYTSPTGYRFATYQRLTLVFENGKLKSWTLDSVTQ